MIVRFYVTDFGETRKRRYRDQWVNHQKCHAESGVGSVATRTLE